MVKRLNLLFLSIKETIVEKKGVASYTIYSPFTAEPLVSATGRAAIQMEIIKDYKVIFELVCALYMEFLPKEIVFTNYRSILEVAREDALSILKNIENEHYKNIKEYIEETLEHAGYFD